MSNPEFVLGKLMSGRAFTIPRDYHVHTTALIGIRGSALGRPEAWEVWKQKLGKGPAKTIDILLERRECTRVQLKTLAGYSERSMTNIVSALNSRDLIQKEGDKIRLRSA